MNDPNAKGGRKAAHAQYIAADDCYRESCLALAEAQAITVRNPLESAIVEEAQQLLQASRMHRTEAAKALTNPSEQEPENDRQHFKVAAQSRMTIQLAIRALMLLSAIPETRSARQKLDFYLPIHRGDKHIMSDEAGLITLSSTPTIFGSNHNGGLPDRPRRIIMLDNAVNHLAQTTRNWEFSRANTTAFCREFLDDTADGHVLQESEVTAWINRRISPAERQPTATGAAR